MIATIATLTLSSLLLMRLIGLEHVDHLSENGYRHRQATSKAKSPVVLISPV